MSKILRLSIDLRCFQTMILLKESSNAINKLPRNKKAEYYLGFLRMIKLFIMVYHNWTLVSIGFKSLNLRKKAGIKFNDLERNFSHFSMILPLDFSEILIICRNYDLFSI